MRITESAPDLPAVQRGKQIEITVNQQKVQAFEGELVSTVLLAEGIKIFNRKDGSGRSSGIYCGMGVCYECLVTIDGVPNVRACQTYIKDGMVIETAAQEPA